MSDEIYKVVEKIGERCNFSIAMYEQKDDPQNSRLAKQIAKQFVEGFARFCDEKKLVMESGIGEVPVIGPASYLAISRDGRRLFMLVVPHDIIEVKGEDE